MGCASSTPFLSAHGGPVKNMEPRGEDETETDVKDGQVKESLIGAVTNIGHSIGDVVKNGTHDIKEMVTTSIEKVPDEIKAHVNKLLNDDKAVIESSLDDLNQTIDSETNTIKENAAKLSKTFDDEIESAVNDADQKVSDVKEDISDVLENVKDDLMDINSVDSMDSLKTTIPEPEIEKALRNSSDDELNSPTPKPTYSELEILQDSMLKNNSTPTNENLANQHKCLSKKLDNLAMQFESFITRFQVNEGTKSEVKNIATSTTSSLEANGIKSQNISEINELKDSADKNDIIYDEQFQKEDIIQEILKKGMIELEDYKEPHDEQEIMIQELNQEPDIKTNLSIDNINVTNMVSDTGTECKFAEKNRDDSKQGTALETVVLAENKEIEPETTSHENEIEFTAETSDVLLKTEKNNVVDVNGAELNTEPFQVEEDQNIEMDALPQDVYEDNKVDMEFIENITENENNRFESAPESHNANNEVIEDEKPIVTESNDATLITETLELEKNQKNKDNDVHQDVNVDIEVSTNHNNEGGEKIDETKIGTYYEHSELPLKKYSQSLPESNEVYSIITDGSEVNKENSKTRRAEPKFENIIKHIQALGSLSVKKQDIFEHKSDAQDETKDTDILETPSKNIEQIEIQSFTKTQDIDIGTEWNTTNMMDHKSIDQTGLPTQTIEINLERPTPSVSENSEKTEVPKKFIPGNLLQSLTKIFGIKTSLENEINSAIKPNIVTDNVKELNEENLNLESTENQTNQQQFQDENMQNKRINQYNAEEENQSQENLEQSNEDPIARGSFIASTIEDVKSKHVVEGDVGEQHSNLTNNTVETDGASLGKENTNIQIHDESKLDITDGLEVIEAEPQKKRKKMHRKKKSLRASQTIIDNHVENDGKSVLEEIITEANEMNETSAFSENISRAPSPIFPLVHRRNEFRKLGWSFLLANLDTLRDIRDSSGIFGNEILATLNILNYFVVEYDKKHRTILDRIDTKLEKLRDFLREKFTHFYFYEKFKQLFKKEEPKLIPQKIIYESDTEEETEEMEEEEPEEVEEEQSEEEETDDELPALDLNKTAEELLNDIEFLVNKDPNDDDMDSTEEEVVNLSENEISETEPDNNEFDKIEEKQIKNYEQKNDEFRENDNQEKMPQLTTSNSVESDKFKKIDEITENIQIQDIGTQILDRQEVNLPNEEVGKPKEILTNESEKHIDSEKPAIKKTPNFLKVAPFKLKKKKTKKKFVNRIPVDPTHWEEIADELAKKSLKNYKKLSRNYSSESVWSGDAGSWKKPNSLYLVFGNNFLRTPKIKIIESGHTNQWTQRSKKDRTELDVYTGKLMTDNDVFQESKEDKRLKWKSFELEMKASQLEMNKKLYNLTDTEDYPIGKSRTEITLDWLKNDIKRFKEEYGAFNRRNFDYFDQDSDFDDENTRWPNRSNRLPYLRNINHQNRYQNLNINPYRNNYHQNIGGERFLRSQNKHSNGVYRFPPNRNLHHKYDRNIFSKNKNISKKYPKEDVYYSSSNSAKSFTVSKDAQKVEETKSEIHLEEIKQKVTNLEAANSESNSGKSIKKDSKNQKNKKVRSNSNANSDEHVTSKESNKQENEIPSDQEEKVKNESNIDSGAKLKTSIDASDDIKNKDHSDNDINLKKSEEEDNELPNIKSNLSKQSSKDSRTSSIKSKINKNPNDAKNKIDKKNNLKKNDFNDHETHSPKPEKYFDDLIQNNLNDQKINKTKTTFKGKTKDRQQTHRSDSDRSQSIEEDKRKYKIKAWLEKQGKNSKHIDSSEIDSNGDPTEKKDFKLPYIKSQYFNEKIGNKNFQNQSFSEDSDINGKYTNTYEEHSSRYRKFKESFDFMHKDFTSDSDENQYEKYHQRSKFMDDSQKYYNYYDYE